MLRVLTHNSVLDGNEGIPPYAGPIVHGCLGIDGSLLATVHRDRAVRVTLASPTRSQKPLGASKRFVVDLDIRRSYDSKVRAQRRRWRK